MDLVDFTTPDDVRALLGVSPDEIEDATLSLSVYSTNLEAELRDINPSFISTYLGVHAKRESERSADESWFYSLTRLHAAYVVARQLTASLPLFSPKEISDGKASFSRYAANPYADTIKAINQQYTVNSGRVASALAALLSTSTGTAVSRPYMRVVTPTSDPVLGT